MLLAGSREKRAMETSMAESPADRENRAKKRGKLVRGTVFALVSGVCFGLSGTASKYVMDAFAIDPLWLSSARQLGACLLFMIAGCITARDQVRHVATTPRLLAQVILYGLLGVTFSQVGYLEAIDLTNSATATVLENSSLVFLLIYTCAKYRRAPYARETLGITLALLGVFLLATGGDPTSMVVPLAGIAWGVGAGFASALIAILPSGPLARLSNFVVNAFAMLAGGIVLVFITQPWNNWPQMTVGGWMLLIFIVAIGTFGAYALYVQAAKDVGPMKATLLATVEPITALVSSAVLLGQVFLPTDIAGFALILTMVFLTAR
jgi:drug/metabolite transporter (DMT)-like permease